jgi:hypothetical protein
MVIPKTKHFENESFHNLGILYYAIEDKSGVLMAHITTGRDVTLL